MGSLSLEQMLQISSFPLVEPTTVKAHDGINLALYPFLPVDPTSIVIFFHGAGLHINRPYQYVGIQLMKEHNIGCYGVDIRGHGHSQGNRGDAPCVNQVLEDVSTVLIYVKNQFPDKPIYLAGHSAGAGLLLNYSQYKNRCDDLYAGYILLAPYLGPKLNVVKKNIVPFVYKTNPLIYLLNGVLGIPCFQHTPAMFFNFPKELLDQDPYIVTAYTYIMSAATTPLKPRHIFEQLSKPCTIIIGAEDELFDAKKVAEFAKYNKKGLVTASIIPGSNHLSILLRAPTLISEFVKSSRLLYL